MEAMRSGTGWLVAVALAGMTACDGTASDAATPLDHLRAAPAPAPPSCAELTLAGVPVGELFLQGRSTAGAAAVAAAVAQLQATVPLPLQISVDQEGGLVQTLRRPGFDDVPTAVEQGRLDPATLRATTTIWAAQLRAAGITMDLGPVADTVPGGR